MTGKPLRTPLYGAHVKLKARMVDFHGWEMPIQYAGIIEEHMAVRTRLGGLSFGSMPPEPTRGRQPLGREGRAGSILPGPGAACAVEVGHAFSRRRCS